MSIPVYVTRLARERGLLNLQEAMEAAGLRKTAIYSRIKQGDFPGPIKIDRHSYWSPDDIEQWIEAQREGE